MNFCLKYFFYYIIENVLKIAHYSVEYLILIFLFMYG